MDSDNTKVILTPSLAPYKIALIGLIAAYCSSVFPKKTNRPMLTVIVKYIEGPSLFDDALESATVPSLLEILRNIKESCIKADPNEGAKHANEIEIRALHALWSLRSLDSLYSFISRAKTLLVKNYTEGKRLVAPKSSSSSSSSSVALPKYLLTHTSFLGRFVLKCVDSFEALEFDKVDLLWRSFVQFRSLSKAIYESELRSRGGLPPDSFGVTNKNDDPSLLMNLFGQLPNVSLESKKDVVLISQEDLLTLLEHQVKVIERYGTATPQELKDLISKMPQSETGKVPTVHYINYLECLREADYEGAFNYLHRYFDYMMSSRTEEIVFYHYALLSLATLYASFNCDGEAIRAIEESIAVARENKDVDCLNFLLTWLFNFLKDLPDLEHHFYVSNDQLLQFLKSKAPDEKFDQFETLHATAYQSDATQIMLEGNSLISTIESLTKSLYISVNCGNDFSAFVSHCSLSSAFWNRSGNLDLAEVYNDIALASSKSSAEQIIIEVRRSYLDYAFGNVEKCFDNLDKEAKALSLDLRGSKDFSNHRLLLLAEQSIRTSNYHAAESYLEKLVAQEYPNIDIQGQVKFLSAKLQLELDNVPTSHEIVLSSLSDFAQKDTNKYWFIKFNILLCDLFVESELSIRALSMSIQLVNLSISSGYFLLTLESVLRLTTILIQNESHTDARDVILGYLPMFEYCEDLYLKSKSYQLLTMVSSKLFEQDRDTLSNDEKIKCVTKIIRFNEVSIDGFKKLSAFKEIKICLESQLTFSELISHQELCQHAKESLLNIQRQIETNETALY